MHETWKGFNANMDVPIVAVVLRAAGLKFDHSAKPTPVSELTLDATGIA